MNESITNSLDWVESDLRARRAFLFRLICVLLLFIFLSLCERKIKIDLRARRAFLFRLIYVLLILVTELCFISGYGVATISRLLKIIGLFCKRSL